MKRVRIVLLAFAIITVFAVLAPAGQKGNSKLPVRVFISVDMEGISGVVHSDQTSPGTPEYGAARKWMAQDVNAAVEGAVEAGATEIIVNDSHGSMRNIDPDDLDPRAVLISGSPKPLSMMQGIGASFQACLLIGYHAKAGTMDAILDHTISGSVVRSVKVNGIDMPELGLNAAIAGYYGVPVILVSGDAAVCRQASEILGKDIVTVQVKEAIGRLAAILVPMPESRRLIKEGVKAGLSKLDRIKPFKPSAPYSFELGFHVSAQADIGAMIPGVKRLDARTLSFVANDYLEGFQKLRAMINIAPVR